MREQIDAWRYWLSNHPLFKRYVALCGVDKDRKINSIPRNTLPWHAQGHRLFAIGTMINAALFMPEVSPGMMQERLAVSRSLYHAQTYLWNDEMYKTAIQAPVPRCTINTDILPYNQMFWSFECNQDSLPAGPKSIEHASWWEEGEHSRWMLVVKAPDGINIIADVQSANPTPDETGFNAGRVGLFGIHNNTTYPDDISEEREGVRTILALLAFLNSPYIDTTQQRLPRSIRRELLRHSETTETTTSVVTLRRRVNDHYPSEDTENTVIRKHKWWVSGHIRAQWYPSTRSHKLIWIAPHLKGPVDAPLLEKTYMVVR